MAEDVEALHILWRNNDEVLVQKYIKSLNLLCDLDHFGPVLKLPVGGTCQGIAARKAS